MVHSPGCVASREGRAVIAVSLAILVVQGGVSCSHFPPLPSRVLKASRVFWEYWETLNSCNSLHDSIYLDGALAQGAGHS